METINECKNRIIECRKRIQSHKSEIKRIQKEILDPEVRAYLIKSWENSIDDELFMIKHYKWSISFNKFLENQENKGLELRWVKKIAPAA